VPASLELVKIALQAYGDGYPEVAIGLADPLVRWDERASRSDGELVWKQDAVARAMRRYLDSWQRYSFELEEIAEVSPGKVVGICRERGVDADGLAVDRRFGGLWVVEDAKIASWSTYLTPREAVRAARELGGKTPAPRSRQGSGGAARSETQGESRGDAENVDEKRRAARARAKLRQRATRGPKAAAG
jgi:ketosteroid isomerase-like protein